jgi:polysaccharide pyruvyl transferase WcaK-like protein
MIDRRTLLATSLATLGARAAQRQKKTPVLMLRSGWQSVNIGDIAHTPGVLALIEKHIPQAEVILWPGEIERGTEPMLQRRFPRLKIIRGNVGPDGKPDTPELTAAFQSADFLLHGSGPSIVAANQFRAWRAATGKPYGFFGVTITTSSEAASSGMDAALKTLIDGSKFLFTRETKSLSNVQQAGVKVPQLKFVPDGTFSFDITDDAVASRFMSEQKLKAPFIAVIPRLRYTPYHKFRKATTSPEESARRDAVNEKHGETDHAKLRQMITAWVRQTGGQALLCPEMTYELDIIDPLLFGPLPADVKPHVVRRKTYWLPDEAASIYRQAAAVVSFECHSPIIAAAQGTPCIYVHQPEDGIKGQMWKDVGLGDWFFEVDTTSGDELARTVLGMHANPAAARRKVVDAVAVAQRLQAEGMAAVLGALSA